MEPANGRLPHGPRARLIVLAALAALTAAAQAQAPASGTKPLYLLDLVTPDPNGFNQGPPPYLSRTPPAVAQTDVSVDKNVPPRVWTMTPATQAPLTIASGAIPVTLHLSKVSANAPPVTRIVTVALGTTGALAGPLGTPVTRTIQVPSSTAPAPFTFGIPLGSAVTLPAGTQLTMTITNSTPGGGTQRVRVFPTFGAGQSRIDLPALTVINVDSAATFDAAYPAGLPETQFAPTDTVSVRAEVSDPFGLFDITGVLLDVTDALGAIVVSGQAMTQVAQTGGASAVYEYVMSLPATAPAGSWNFTVTASEGTEGTIVHTRAGSFTVSGTSLLVTKSVAAIADPVNGSANPKAIPGATMLYTLTVSNQGLLATDSDSLVVTDRLPPQAALYVDAAAGDPIVFLDGSPPTGLTFDYGTDVSFSSQAGGGAPFNYVPVPDAAGFDDAVTGFRVNPGGSLGGTVGGTSPQFELRYRLRVD